MVRNIRWRYLIFHLHIASNPQANIVRNCLRKHLKMFLGTLGMAKHSIMIMSYNEMQKLGIIRCPHDAVTLIRAALALLDNVDGEPASLHIMKSTGTLKKAKSLLRKLSEKLKFHWSELEAGMKRPSQATES